MTIFHESNVHKDHNALVSNSTLQHGVRDVGVVEGASAGVSSHDVYASAVATYVPCGVHLLVLIEAPSKIEYLTCYFSFYVGIFFPVFRRTNFMFYSFSS